MKSSLNYTVLLIFCIFFVINNLYSQPSKHGQYREYFLLGEHAMGKKDYSRAIEYYDSASFLFLHFHKLYFQAIICASQLDDYEKTYQYAVKLIHQEFLLGGIEPFLPSYEDAYCRDHNLPLRYAVSLKPEPNDIYLPIEELNKNRKEAGLPSIEFEARLEGIDITNLFKTE